ncbi:MAG: hypothetical protein GAK32_00342 [Pseudomonas fluorescens]|nr:MAG: hypothetical protein GAK32_00342 [Pseudomonas fluorescens]
MVAFERLAVQIDVKPFGLFDLDPRQARPHEQVVQSPTIGHQAAQRTHHLLGRRQDADVQQAVIRQRIRAQHMPAARLAPVADPQRQQLATPVEARPLQFCTGGPQLTEAGQAGEQIGGAPQHFLQVFGRVDSHLAAETARGHVEENLIARLPQINPLCRGIEQRQRPGGLQCNAGGTRKIIGGTQRKQYEAGLRLGTGHGFGDIAQGAITTTGNQVGVTGRQGFINQPPGITGFPRDPHGQIPTLLAPGLHGGTNLFVEGLFAVKDKKGFGCWHENAPGSG